MKKQIYNHGIILPLKESFFKKNCGAVSLYVNEFLKKKNSNKTIIFASKGKGEYLNKNVFKIEVKNKLFTNTNYIKKIYNLELFKNLETVEVHNRPNYAEYLLKKNPQIKLSLFLHNEFYKENNLINNK